MWFSWTSRCPSSTDWEATRRIVQDPTIASRIVILTTFERDDYVFEGLQAGASGFLLKNAPPEQLVDAVRVVAAGDALLAPSVTRTVLEAFAHGPAPRADQSILGRLTEREREVLQHLATGRSNSELAAQLFLGEGTIKTHVSKVLTKLGLRDRLQAVAVLDILDAATAAALGRELTDIPGHYSFAHALIQTTLYEDFSARP